MPGSQGIDHQTGKSKRYPYINLKDEDKKKEVMYQLMQEGPIFIEKRLNDTERPIVWPEIKHKNNGFSAENLPKNEELVNNNHKKITEKIWVNPPKRDSKSRMNSLRK